MGKRRSVARALDAGPVDAAFESVGGLGREAETPRRSPHARGLEVGALQEHVGGRLADLGLGERVRFLGERDVLPELLASADVFALASDSESFGLSALEAMSCGTAVVATDAGGVREVVTHERTGLLSPRDDVDAYAHHLRSLLFDRDRSESMGQRAREDALEREAASDSHTRERPPELRQRLLGRVSKKAAGQGVGRYCHCAAQAHGCLGFAGAATAFLAA